MTMMSNGRKAGASSARYLVAAMAGAALVLLAAAPPAAAAARGQDPDWPCRQRLVPTLTAATFWNGPTPDAGADWHADPAVAALVQNITPRRVPTADGEKAIDAFVEGLAPDQRKREVPLAFAGLLDETNRERDELISRIKQFTRRQRSLAEVVDRLTEELDTIPKNATGADAERRADLEQRQFYTTKAFQDAERTVRYACDAPVQLEARLGAYARRLQAALSG
jgi:hypothetical protein